MNGATPTLGEQLDQISKDLSAAYAAMRAAGASWDSPESEAVEAVYVRLRAWNSLAAAR